MSFISIVSEAEILSLAKQLSWGHSKQQRALSNLERANPGKANELIYYEDPCFDSSINF
jgi:hypothetical protein